MPLIAGMGVTAVITYGILMFEGRGFRPVELIIGSHGRHYRALLPDRGFHRRMSIGRRRLFIRSSRKSADADALLISVGIIGATVMPHAIYLHSGLTQARIPAHDDNEKRAVVRYLKSGKS